MPKGLIIILIQKLQTNLSAAAGAAGAESAAVDFVFWFSNLFFQAGIYKYIQAMQTFLGVVGSPARPLRDYL